MGCSTRAPRRLRLCQTAAYRQRAAGQGAVRGQARIYVQCSHLRAGAPEPRRTRRGKGLGIGGMPGRSRPPGEAGWGVFLNTRVVESGGQGNGGVQGLWNWIAYNWPSNAVSPSCPASLALVLIVWCVLSCGGSSVCVRSSPARSAIRGAVRDVPPSGGCPIRTAYAAYPSMLQLRFFIKNA